MENLCRAGFLALLPAIATIGGCDGNGSTGDLRIGWTVGLDDPTVTACEAASIESVLVSLAGPDHDFEETVSCASGERTFRDIPVEHYDVTVQGLDADGCRVYEGSEDGVVPVGGAEPGQATVIMQAVAPSGSLDLEWAFEDGGLCGVHGVTEVDLLLLSDDVTVAEETLSCDLGAFVAADVPAGSIDVSVTAVGTGGTYCWVGTDLTLAPCSTLPVQALLEICP